MTCSPSSRQPGEKGEETIVHAVLDRGEEVRFDNHTELLSRDGKRYHVTASASPIREADGEISGAVLFFRDVTDDFEKRATLNAQNAILRNATEVARIVYFRCDETGRMTPLGDFGRHWGCRDGGPVPAEEWLDPADLDGYRRELTGSFRVPRTRLTASTAPAARLRSAATRCAS